MGEIAIGCLSSTDSPADVLIARLAGSHDVEENGRGCDIAVSLSHDGIHRMGLSKCWRRKGLIIGQHISGDMTCVTAGRLSLSTAKQNTGHN